MRDEPTFTVASSSLFTMKAVNDWETYDIDYEKVQTLEDVKNILRGLNIIISISKSNPNPDFAPLMPYLKLRAKP